MTRLTVSLFLLFAFTASNAHAEESTWGLRWQAPATCIDPASLARAVEAKLGRHIFALSPSYRIDGVVTQTEPGWRAVLTVIDSGGSVSGSRDVTTTKGCHDLDEQVTLVIAVMIDPQLRPTKQAPMVVTEPKPAPVGPQDPPGRDSVRVHLSAENRATRLMRVASQGFGTAYGGGTSATVSLTQVETVCAAPCDRWVDRAEQQFYIAGQGITPSKPFTLVDHAPAVELNVKTGSLGKRVGGIWALVGGMGLILGGGLGVLLTAGIGQYDFTTGTITHDLTGFALGSLIAAGVGVVLAIIGIPLLTSSGTSVDFSAPTPDALPAVALAP